MAENIRVIEIKKRKLKEELSKENPDKKVVKRLRESIKRHKEIALTMRNIRVRVRKKNKY